MINKKRNSGITLIALVITIIVLLILAGVTVATLTGDNGLFGKTTEAKFKGEIKQYEEELRLKIGEEDIEALGNRTNTINVFKKFPSTGEENENFEQEMKSNIPSFNNSKYGNKLEIRNDELIYTDEQNKQERKWFGEVNLSLAKYFITVNYVDKQGNKLAEPETISTTTGLYEVEPKIIEGYEAERPIYDGKTKEDTEITITYLQESGDLAYIGLDESGNETYDESKIVAYTVSGIGNFTGEDLVIPRTYNNKSVTQIKDSAFKNNKTIKTLTITSTIDKIKRDAFIGCSNLEYINVDGKMLEDACFFGIINLKKLDIGKSVEKTGTSSFQNCTSLNNLTIYSESENISAIAFLGCIGVNDIKVNINNSKLKEIDGVLYSKDGKRLYMYPQGKQGDFIVPSHVEKIYPHSCRNNQYIKNVEISKSVKSLDTSAFENCGNLENANIDAENIGSNSFLRMFKIKKSTNWGKCKICKFWCLLQLH